MHDIMLTLILFVLAGLCFTADIYNLLKQDKPPRLRYEPNLFIIIGLLLFGISRVRTELHELRELTLLLSNHTAP